MTIEVPKKICGIIRSWIPVGMMVVLVQTAMSQTWSGGLYVEERDTPSAVEYEIFLKSQSGVRSVWRRDVGKINGVQYGEGASITSWERSGDSLIALVGINDTKLALIQSDNVQEKIESVVMGDPGWLQAMRFGVDVHVEAPDRIVVHPKGSDPLVFFYSKGILRKASGEVIDPNPVIRFSKDNTPTANPPRLFDVLEYAKTASSPNAAPQSASPSQSVPAGNAGSSTPARDNLKADGPSTSAVGHSERTANLKAEKGFGKWWMILVVVALLAGLWGLFRSRK